MVKSNIKYSDSKKYSINGDNSEDICVFCLEMASTKNIINSRYVIAFCFGDEPNPEDELTKLYPVGICSDCFFDKNLDDGSIINFSDIGELEINYTVIANE